MKTILEQLERDLEIAEKATKGRWLLEISPYAYNHQTYAQQCTKGGVVVVSGLQAVNDGEFITHARTRLPQLAEALKVAVESLESLRECGDKYDSSWADVVLQSITRILNGEGEKAETSSGHAVCNRRDIEGVPYEKHCTKGEKEDNE